MTFADRDGVALKLELPSDYHMAEVLSWAAEHPKRWRSLWMLTLRESRGWSVGRIAAAVGLTRGHVSRLIRKTRREITRQLNPEAIAS